MQWNVASAAPPDDPADRAAEDIAEAQERANGAAEAYFEAEAEAEIDALELEAADLEVRRSRLASKVARLRRAADAAAVDEFVAAGARGFSILNETKDGDDQSHAVVYRSVAVNGSLEDIDAYEAADLELEALDHEIEDQSAELDDVKEAQLELQAQAEAEVVRLREVEEQRLRDEAIRRELERRQAEAAVPSILTHPSSPRAADPGLPASSQRALDRIDPTMTVSWSTPPTLITLSPRGRTGGSSQGTVAQPGLPPTAPRSSPCRGTERLVSGASMGLGSSIA